MFIQIALMTFVKREAEMIRLAIITIAIILQSCSGVPEHCPAIAAIPIIAPKGVLMTTDIMLEVQVPILKMQITFQALTTDSMPEQLQHV